MVVPCPVLCLEGFLVSEFLVFAETEVRNPRWWEG